MTEAEPTRAPDRAPRVTICTRVSLDGLTAIDEFAEEEGRTRADMMRRLLAEAVAARLRARRKH